MALLFSASTDKVTAGSNAALDDLTTATYLAWVYPTSTADGRICMKGLFNGTGARHLSVTPGGGHLQISVERATTNLEATASANAVTLNTWNFVAGVHNTGGANGDQKLYIGTLAAPAAEVATYSVRAVGTGAPNSNASATQIIGNKSNDAVPFPGRIAWLGIWRRELPLGEIRQQQFRLYPSPGCVFWMPLGLQSGASSAQLDYSGWGNHGTVTGAVRAEDTYRLVKPFGYLARW